MSLFEPVDHFLKRHPALFFLGLILLAVVVTIVLLGGYRDVGLVYKAF